MTLTLSRTSLVSSAAVAALFLSVLAWQARSSEEVVSAEEAPVDAAATMEADAVPVLTSVATKNVRASHLAQEVTFRGKHFLPRMTARVFTPDGFLVAYGPASVQKVTETTFTLSADLATSGTYTVVTRNPSGRLSNEMTFVVGAARAAR